MKNLEQVKEVSAVDQFLAVMDLLGALGYDTSKLTMLDAASLRHGILKAIEECESVDLTPFMEDI